MVSRRITETNWREGPMTDGKTWTEAKEHSLVSADAVTSEWDNGLSPTREAQEKSWLLMVGT